MLGSILPSGLLALLLLLAVTPSPTTASHKFPHSQSKRSPSPDFLSTPAELSLLRQSLSLFTCTLSSSSLCSRPASSPFSSSHRTSSTTSTSKKTSNPFAKYSSIVIFGDSYSDNSHPRTAANEEKLPGPPYDGGRYSNGLVWNEYLAEKITKNGTLYNYAYGGAQINNKETGNSKAVPATLDQVKTHISDLRSGKIDTTSGRTLYVMFSGINPITALWVKLIASPPAPSVLPKSSRDASKTQAQEAVSQLLSVDLARRGLSGGGGEWDVLIMTIPSLDETPSRGYMVTEKDKDGKKKQLNLLKEMSQRFNNDVKSGVETLKNGTKSGTGVYLWDLGKRWSEYKNSPELYGLNKSTVLVPCAKNNAVCDDPSRRLYWDSIHPVTSIHQKIANDVQFTVGA